MRWVVAEKLAADTGLTKGGIDARRSRGLWKLGVHFSKAADGRVWYDIEAIEEWVKSSSPEPKQSIVNEGMDSLRALRSAEGKRKQR